MLSRILAFLALSVRAQDIDFAHEYGIIQPKSWNLAKGKKTPYFSEGLELANFTDIGVDGTARI